MGWTSASAPKCNAASWNANPRIMLASPASQIGRRASRKMSQMSTPAAPGLLAFLAPRRWHTEDVAVQKLAARASGIALSIFPHSASPVASQSPRVIEHVTSHPGPPDGHQRLTGHGRGCGGLRVSAPSRTSPGGWYAQRGILGRSLPPVRERGTSASPGCRVVISRKPGSYRPMTAAVANRPPLAERAVAPLLGRTPEARGAVLADYA